MAMKKLLQRTMVRVKPMKTDQKVKQRKSKPTRLLPPKVGLLPPPRLTIRIPY